MELDLELYRRDVLIPDSPPVRLSLIDISPEKPEQTLLFIHGFGGQATQWQYQLDTFSKSNRVLGLDLRGHGHSEAPPRGYEMKGILRDIHTALEQSEVNEKITLIGHSFGGAIAADFSITYPDRIERLILIATPIKYRLNWFFRTGLRLPSYLLGAITPFTRSWLGAPPAILKSFYNANMKTWDGVARFNLVNHPTLIIRGDRDRVFERPAFEEVEGQIAGA
ncbi:MAG: alpha/beta fold hydrolase, partial [Anaerolineales bacterium]|nr:alpha/beta fold hydrolase [Anaerolineales bacterium]